MLMAIARGKGGRLTLPGIEAPLSWRDVFKQYEDLLTGAVFGRLRFLTPFALAQVMASLLGQREAEALGDLLEIEFWPRFPGGVDRTWVEPDVLLRFSGGTVLVEVKPPNGGQQSPEQWWLEIKALLKEERGAGSDGVVYFLAMGNTRHRDGEVLRADSSACGDVPIYCREWRPFAVAVKRLAEQSVGSDMAVFGDVVEALSLFGIEVSSEPDWGGVIKWMRDKELWWPIPEISSFPGRSAQRGKKSAPSARWAELVDYLNVNPWWTNEYF